MKAFGNLHIEVLWLQDGSARVNWSGESDALDPGAALTPYLADLVRTLRGKSVQVHFGNLRYMNSSTVTPLMQFIRDLSAAAMRVTVLYRADLQWQVTSFRAMRVVARKWSNVDVSAE